MRDNFIKKALSQEGIVESGTNNVKYNSWYYGRDVEGEIFPWCVTFISWCAFNSGISEEVIPKAASVEKLYEFYKTKNQFYSKGSNLPKIGDIFVILGEDAHAGIVVSVSGTTVETLEGNVESRVKRVTRKLDDSSIFGYCSPEYENAGEITPVSFFNKEVFSPTPKIKDEPQNPPTKLSSGTEKQPKYVKVYSPLIEVSVHTESGKLSAVSSSNLDSSVENIVLSVSTDRVQEQDCCTFSVSMTYKGDLYSKIASNDLVIINIEQPPEPKDSVMFGLVDDIRRSVDYSTGLPLITIIGRGFCKALVNFDVGFIESISVEFGQGWFGNQLSLVGLSSFQAIQKTLSSFIGNSINYSFSGGSHIRGLMAYSGAEHAGERLVDVASYTSYLGSLWGFIKDLGNTPFNETYWEVMGGKPTLIHRPTPFNPKDWNSLQKFELEDIDIISESLGRSDLETYTVYSVKGTLLDEAISKEYLPFWYPPYYSKYGIKHLQVNTIYQMWVGGLMDKEHIKQFFADLFNFNIKNNVMENGTITVKGSQKYKVGSRLFVKSTGMEYYIEGVSHNYSFYSTYTTDLKVTRGLEPSERFSSPWGGYSEMTPSDMSRIVSGTGISSGIPFNPQIQFNGVQGGTSYQFNSLCTQRECGTNTSSYQVDGQPSGTDFSPPLAEYISDNNLPYGGYMDGNLNWPCPTCSDISSPFGLRVPPPISGLGTWHTGIDIPAGIGQPIVAAASGTVEFVRNNNQSTGYGNYVKIKHSDTLSTLYAHCSTVLVNVGDRINLGQKIATIGSTGDSTGPHLHFETIVNGTQVDPVQYFSNRNSQPEEITRSIETTQPSSVVPSGSVESSCFKFLSQYFNTAAVCGILANISAESSFVLSAVGDGGTSYGLCQWHNERYENLKKTCYELGLDYRTVTGQMTYLIHELRTSYSHVMSKLSSVPNTPQGAYDSAYYWCTKFEIPANADSNGRIRGNSAKTTYWNRYKPSQGSGSTSQGSGGNYTLE